MPVKQYQWNGTTWKGYNVPDISPGSAPAPPTTAMPVGNLDGWTQVFSQDFLTPAALGQVGTVYGTNMRGYDNVTDTSGNGTYTPDRVLSVANGVLDWFVHTEVIGGVSRPRVAAPVPMGYGGQTYGRYSVRFRSDSVAGYKMAFLLWPASNVWDDGEIDGPESQVLGGPVYGASLKVGSPTSGGTETTTTDTFADAYSDAYTITTTTTLNGAVFDPQPEVFSPQDTTGWHIWTTEWTPGLVRWYWDGQLLSQTLDASKVPATPMRWTLQVETALIGGAPSPTASGHVQVDWITAYSYTPSVRATVPPVANFTGTPLSGTVPFNVQFTDTSTNDPTSWAWTFGDGTTSTVKSPAKTYSTAGTYSVSLTATNAAGSNTFTRSNYIAAAAPAPSGSQPSGTPASLKAWTLQFEDLFSGSSVDTSKWNVYDYDPASYKMNNVGPRASNVAVTGGNLVLTLADANNGAMITTGTVDFRGTNKYLLPVGGYCEARIWFAGSGSNVHNWPAWWTAGDTWPTPGEHDIAEVLSARVAINYHWGTTSNHQQIGQVAPSGTWHGAFHTFGLHRKAGSADVYWDGVLKRSYTTNDPGTPVPMILNMGYSGNSVAYGSAGQMLVDYVRAWT